MKSLTQGRGCPGLGRFLIDKEKLSSLAEQIRDAVPVDLSEAQELLQMRERLINQALLEASRVKNAADEDARMRVAESELTRDAQHQADAVVTDAQSRASKMLAEAEAQARSRIEGADTYVQETLQQLEETLTGDPQHCAAGPAVAPRPRREDLSLALSAVGVTEVFWVASSRTWLWPALVGAPDSFPLMGSLSNRHEAGTYFRA